MKRIGIIGAMDIEVDGLKSRMELTQTLTKANMEFFEGRLCGMEAVVVKCGVGKVNAAVCTQILADQFQIDAVINTGVAGSLDSSIDIGDFVISTDVLHHDMDVQGLGYQPGQIPGIKVLAFPADERLIRAAQEACRRECPDQKAFPGRVVSGDQFVESKEKKEYLVSQFSGLCTEMEGAAIAQASWLNQLPFVVIRAISDKADESSHMDYPAFEAMAARNSTRLVCALLEMLSEEDFGN